MVEVGRGRGLSAKLHPRLSVEVVGAAVSWLALTSLTIVICINHEAAVQEVKVFKMPAGTRFY